MAQVQVAEPIVKGPKGDTVEIAVVVEPPKQNDSSEGLARMYADLELPAARLRSHAMILLCIAVLMCGEPAGFFGLVAAVGVLCCAAPGSLGTAYAARCTRIFALLSAFLALGQLMALLSLSFVLPELPAVLASHCEGHHDVAKLAIVAEGAQPDLAFTEPPMRPMAERGAVVLVGYGAHAARKLQDVAPSLKQVKCENLAEMADSMLPYMISTAMLIELCLFIAALNVAKSAARLMADARRFGANGL